MWLRALVWLAVGSTATADGGPWWKDAVVYRMLVDSFKDSDGDGLGDIPGAIKQLSYVRALGGDAILLSALSSKSTDCGQPGVTDFSNLDIRYGTLADFTGLLEKAKKLELKVALELPLQTVSAASEWFTSSANRSAGYEDWILWREGSRDQPPEKSPEVDSWVWNEHRQSYWASHDKQAVLNLCSSGVNSALSAAVCAWVRRGVSGVMLSLTLAEGECGALLARQLATEAVHCARSAGLDTPALILESSMSPSAASALYGVGSGGVNSILSGALAAADRPSAADLALKILTDLLYAPADLSPTWASSRLNTGRLATRYGGDLVDAINLITLTLPGTAMIQQGDELGAADTLLEWAVKTPETCWPSDTIPAAAPFPWDDTVNGGFSAGEPWMPLAPNYRYANAKTQFGSDSSHVGVVRVAAAMRKSPAIGPHVEITRLGDALSILRWGGTGSLLLICNLGKAPTEAQLSRVPGLPHELTVAVSSAGAGVAAGTHISLDKPMKLAPGEAVLMAGAPRHCGGPGPVDKIATKLAEGWQKINKYFNK